MFRKIMEKNIFSGPINSSDNSNKSSINNRMAIVVMNLKFTINGQLVVNGQVIAIYSNKFISWPSNELTILSN